VSRGALALVLILTLAGLTALVLVFGRRGAPSGTRVVEAGQPLPMDETVRLRFSDEETGEEDIWIVKKRTSTAEDSQGPQVPSPAPVEAFHEPDDSARALLATALQAWKQGEIVEARALLEQSIEQDPDDPLPRTHYGRLLALTADFGGALPHLERAAELAPDDPQVWLDLATTYGLTGQLRQSWDARSQAKALAGGRAINQDKITGFWVLEGESIQP
jgi:tetratricopeptide (TPR) repeat protein